MYAEFLRYVGLTPIVASDAMRELSVAPETDVIVTALLLPGRTDGVGLIEQLKQDERTRHIPIIVLTSSAWDVERERASRAGCDLFLAKPCLPEELLRGIHHVLASSQRHKTGTPAKPTLARKPRLRH